MLIYNIINVSYPGCTRVANTLFSILLALVDIMVDCPLHIVLAKLLTANVISGLVMIDKYNKLSMADWYSC